MKIREKLERLQRMYPKRDASGMMYRNREKLAGRFKRISLWTILVSTENTHQVHECMIDKKQNPKTRQQWRVWIAANAANVYKTGVLPGLGIRTAPKQWAVMRVIGWTAHDRIAPRKSRAPRRKK